MRRSNGSRATCPRLLLREPSWSQRRCNCWKRVRAERVAFLIDAESYFDRLVSTFERARRSILIVGWDLHSRTRLRRGEQVDEDRYRLGALLDRVARDNRELHVKLLAWDFAMIYMAEREVLQRYRLGWRPHRRMHFALDSGEEQAHLRRPLLEHYVNQDTRGMRIEASAPRPGPRSERTRVAGIQGGSSFWTIQARRRTHPTGPLCGCWSDR